MEKQRSEEDEVLVVEVSRDITRGSFWRPIKRSPATVAGLCVVIVMILIGLIAPVLAPYQPEVMRVPDRLEGPSTRYLMGTDKFGRDIFSRVLYGARISLVVGAGATLIAAVVGTLLGSGAAFWGGWADEVTMRIMDVMLAFPYIILAIVLVAIVGPGLQNLILVIGVVRIPGFARVARSSVLRIKEFDFVEAARSIGQSQWGILWRHVLPNCIGPVLVLASMSIGTAIGTESTLSFLGLGIQPPVSSWGTMLADGRSYMFDAPWVAVFPGLAISLTILGYNLVGDGLRDALDPMWRKEG
jgi:ABC-type dipeptide/oligopeptide/nickel transport system permease subunit